MNRLDSDGFRKVLFLNFFNFRLSIFAHQLLYSLSEPNPLVLNTSGVINAKVAAGIFPERTLVLRSGLFLSRNYIENVNKKGQSSYIRDQTPKFALVLIRD